MYQCSNLLVLSKHIVIYSVKSVLVDLFSFFPRIEVHSVVNVTYHVDRTLHVPSSSHL